MIITIVSDIKSWMNQYIPAMIDTLKSDDHVLSWVHKVVEIPTGDIVFYLGCGQLVPREVLSRNRHNLVCHESALPKGKGWSPLTWQILEGASEVLVTLFEAVEEVDSGAIYLQDLMRFNGTELVDELRKAQAETSINMCLSFLKEYPAPLSRGIPQHGEATYYRRRRPEDSRLDLDKSIRQQFNLLRVVDNERYPAFFELGGERYIIRIKKLSSQSFQRGLKESQLTMDPQLMEKATSTNSLNERANVNQQYGMSDFEGWVGSLLDRIMFSNVLDVCCGTGNQLVKYATRNREATLTGADISEKSLVTADKRLKEQGATRYRLTAVSMEDLFQDKEMRGQSYDLISCFYGLYYSQNTSKTLSELIDHLSGDGSILIVGPYGRNNAALFDILQKHFTLPELVMRSSSTFMEQEVYPVLSASLTVSTSTFVNPVRYPNPQVVVDYWKSSTFYSEAHAKAVTRDIKAHFEKHGGFVMEKHVMAYLARRK